MADLLDQIHAQQQQPQPQQPQGDLLDQLETDVTGGEVKDLSTFENKANPYAYTTPTGIAVYQAAPLLPEAERLKQPPPEGTFLHEAFVAPGKQLASGFMSSAAGANRLTANIADLLDTAAQKIGELTGTPKVALFKHIEDWAKAGQLAQEKRAAELSEGRQDLPSQIYRGVGQALTSIPTYAVAAELGGPVGGMAGLGALETEDQGWKNMLLGAAEGAVTGGALQVMGPAGRPLRIAGNALLTYAQLRRAGVDHQTALAQALAMGGVAGLGRGGGPGLREMAGNIPMPSLPSLPRVANVLTPQERANQAWLTARGIETPLSMQTGSRAAAALEGTTQGLPGGGKFAETMQAQKEKLAGPVAREIIQGIHPESLTPEESGAAVQQTIGQALERARTGLAEEVAPGGTVTPEAAGTQILGAGKAAIRAKHQAANEAYQSAWQAERDPRNFEDVSTGETDEEGNPKTETMALPIDMAPVQAALKPLLARYEYTLTATERSNSPGVNIMRQIVGGSRYKPASAAELDLGMLKDAARTEKGLVELRDVSQGLAARAVAELQEAVDAKMAGAEHPDGPGAALEHLRAGRKATAEKHDIEDVYKGFGRNIEEVEPVGAYRRMVWEGDSGIQHLREVAKIAPDAMPAVGRAFIEGGGNWKSLGPETKKILFRDPNVIEDLDQYYAKQERLGPLLKLEPVELFKKMTARGGTHINLMQDIATASPEQKSQIARTLVEGLLDRVTREGDIQKAQSTLDQWLTMDPKTKATLIDNPQQIRDLDNLFFGMKRIMRNPNPSGSGYLVALNNMKGHVFRGLGTYLGGQHGGGGVAAGVGAVGGLGAGAAAEYGTNAALARLLFNQKFIRLLTRGMNSAANGDSAGAELSVRSLNRLMEQQSPPEGPEGPTGPPQVP